MKMNCKTPQSFGALGIDPRFSGSGLFSTPMGALGIDPATAITAGTTGIKVFSDIFGGGGGPNIAKTFSRQVGGGKTYLQHEADAIKARGAQYGIDPVQLAKTELQLGRQLSPDEMNYLARGGQPAQLTQPAATGYRQPYQQPQMQQQSGGGLLPLLMAGAAFALLK